MPFAVDARVTVTDVSGYNLSTYHQPFSVTPDGQSFLFLRPRDAGEDRAPRLVWVDHWFSDLEARLKG